MLCYKSALFWDFTRRWMVVSYRRLGTTYQSHLQGSSTPWNQTLTNIASGCPPPQMKNSGCAPGATVRSEEPSHIGSNFELFTKLWRKNLRLSDGGTVKHGFGQASTKLTKRITQFDVFKNRVLGENFPTTKKTSPPPAYCRVCSCNGQRHFQVLLNWNLQGEEVGKETSERTAQSMRLVPVLWH